MMDEKTASLSAGYVRDRILRLSATIDEIRDHFSELHPYGVYSAAAPYIERDCIPALIDDLGPAAAKEELFRHYHAALSRLSDLESELGEAYRERLRHELRIRTDAYAAAACHERLCNNGQESSGRIRDREILAILMDELSRDTDLDGICRLIALLDDGWSDQDGTLCGMVTAAGEFSAGNARGKTCGCIHPGPTVEP